MSCNKTKKFPRGGLPDEAVNIVMSFLEEIYNQEIQGLYQIGEGILWEKIFFFIMDH